MRINQHQTGNAGMVNTTQLHMAYRAVTKAVQQENTAKFWLGASSHKKSRKGRSYWLSQLNKARPVTNKAWKAYNELVDAYNAQCKPVKTYTLQG